MKYEEENLDNIKYYRDCRKCEGTNIAFSMNKNKFSKMKTTKKRIAKYFLSLLYPLDVYECSLQCPRMYIPSARPSISILVFFYSAYPLCSQSLSFCLSLSLSLFLVISRREAPEASSGTMPNKSSLVRPGFPPTFPSLSFPNRRPRMHSTPYSACTFSSVDSGVH